MVCDRAKDRSPLFTRQKGVMRQKGVIDPLTSLREVIGRGPPEEGFSCSFKRSDLQVRPVRPVTGGRDRDGEDGDGAISHLGGRRS